MNYPVWYVPAFGGGLLIAMVAIVHVFVSHFAVGGGASIWCWLNVRPCVKKVRPSWILSGNTPGFSCC